MRKPDAIDRWLYTFWKPKPETKLWCKIFGHNFKPAHFQDWKKDETNFICERCGQRAKSFKNTKWKYRNKFGSGTDG